MHDRVGDHPRPFVVNCDQIPSLSDRSPSEGLQRPFLAHPRLSEALASEAAALSWLSLTSGQRLEPRRHQQPGLLLVLRGDAELIGSSSKLVERGDVITLPPNQEYGLRGVGAKGFEALHVSFRVQDLPRGDKAQKQASLEALIAQNDKRLHAWLNTGYFRMIQDGTLDSRPARARFKSCLRVFSDFFQTFLFTRQATCRDEEYRATFNTHLSEEFGHNVLMRATPDPRVQGDPRLHATLSWFCYQMFVQDNAGKAVINLVLESGGYHFHNIAKPAFKGDDVEEYFDTHAEDDERHQSLGLDLLEGLEPNTYETLLGVLNDGWDMLEATTQRILELVRLEHELS